MNATDFQAFEKSIDLASKMLTMITQISVRRNIFKKMRPHREQIGWSYGFCDSYAQSIGKLDDRDHFLFISVVLENVYGKVGLKYFADVFATPDSYSHSMMSGGTAHLQWYDKGMAPIMPRYHQS